MTEKTTMNKASIYLLSITALFVALTYVFTAFVNIRLPIAANGGLIHLGNVPLFQNRRSRMPVISSSRPTCRCSRSYNGCRRVSSSSDVTTFGGSSAATAVMHD